MDASNEDKKQELLKCIFEEFKNKEIRFKQLQEEQQRQWLKLQEEFEEREKLLCQKLNLPLISSTGKLLTDFKF